MKSKLFFLCLICCLQISAQQSSVSGVVSIFNSETRTGKRQYVSNAQVENDSNKVQPTVTNENGKFKLIFVGINEKESVSFVVRKAGLQVVNIDALSAIAGQNDILKISMANPDSIAEYRRKIYNVGKTEAEKYQERLAIKINMELIDLKKNGLQNKNKIAQLEAELSQSEKQRKKIEEQAQELATKYAPVNLDDVSSLFREAFLLFQKGNLDAAQLLLNQADLPDKIDSILLEEKKIEQTKKDLTKRDSLMKKRKKECAEGLLLKADLHKTSYEFDSASYCYEQLIKLDSLNIDYLFKYARFLLWLNQHDKAIYYYSKLLIICKSLSDAHPQTYEPDVAKAQNYLGILYVQKNDYEKAETTLMEALEIRMRLARTNPQTYEPAVASTQSRLGILYASKKDYLKAEVFFLQSLEVYKRLAKVNPQTYEPDLANTQNNLGALYRAKNDYVKAETALLETLEVYKSLAKVNPQTYEPDLANTQNNLGVLYRAKNDYVKAEGAYQEALEIYKRLAKNNPQTFEPDVALSQNNLGAFYSQKKDYDKAESAYLESLKIRKRLAMGNMQTYEPDVAATQNNLGLVYNHKKDYAKSEVAYMEALEIYKRCAMANAQTYEPNVAVTQNNLGNLYRAKKDSAKAEGALLEALRIYEHLARINPQSYEPNVAAIQNNLGGFYYEIDNFVQSEFFLIESLKIGVRWMNKYPEVYTNQVNNTSRVLLILYTYILDTLKYDAFRKSKPDNFETVENILNNQSKKDAEVAQKLSSYYGARSWYLLFAFKFKEAEQAATKGLEIDPVFTLTKIKLAHSLFFQGKYEDALKVYRELKLLKNKDGKSYYAICLEDLDELEKNGVSNKDMNKIRGFLKE